MEPFWSRCDYFLLPLFLAFYVFYNGEAFTASVDSSRSRTGFWGGHSSRRVGPTARKTAIPCGGCRRDGARPPSSALSFSSSYSPEAGEEDDDDESNNNDKFTKEENGDDDELSDERKASLFQFLLRDLQVEGVPLLGVDVDRVHTLQAALWTTMAELSLSSSRQDDGQQQQQQKACLIMEDISIDKLRAFVDDFTTLKSQDRLVEHMPELNRFNVSLVGKGVGPAIVIEAGGDGSDDDDKDTSSSSSSPSTSSDVGVDDGRCIAAMKMFVDRMAPNDDDVEGDGDERGAAGVVADDIPGPVSYRVGNFDDACHIMSSFWNCVCELHVTPSNQPASTILLLPGVTRDETDRFAAVAELMSRSLRLYDNRGEDDKRDDDDDENDDRLDLDLLHFHPSYDRDGIYPWDGPAHGHLPPTSWLRSALKKGGDLTAVDDDADNGGDIDAAITASNYRRRSPVCAVCIRRVDRSTTTTTTRAADAEDVDAEPGDGSAAKAKTDVAPYAKNAIRLYEKGEEMLRAELERELAVLEG